MGDLLDWVNRTGMIFVFISFWFAAPEILGQSRLRTLEQNFKQILLFIQSHVFHGIVFLVFPIFFLQFMLDISTQGTSSLSVVKWTLISIAISVIAVALTSAITLLTQFILEQLADDKWEKVRQRALIIGVSFFVAGSLMQFIATFKVPISK